MKKKILLDGFKKKLLVHWPITLAFALFFVGAVLWIFQASIYLWIGYALLGAIGISLVRYTFSLGVSLRFSIFLRLMKVVKAARKICQISSGVKFLHACTFLIIFCAVTVLLTTKNASIFQAANTLAFSFLALSAVYELTPRINKLVQRTWAKALGKIFSLTIGAALLYFSTTIAKHFVHSVVQVDPKHFVEFTGILAVLLLPFLYFFIGTFLFSLWALLLIFLLGAFVVISHPLQFVVGCLSESGRKEVRIYWFRIRTGKNPKGDLPKPPLFSWEYMHLFLRPVSIIAVIGVFALPFEWMGQHSAQVDQALKKALVSLEYRPNSRCIGLSDKVRVAYLDGGLVSTVKIENGTYVFDTAECKTIR